MKFASATLFAVCALIGFSPAHARQPADGMPPFAFAVAPVSFSNADVKLSGAVLKPEGNGPFPAVVMVHGAGGGTFDEPALRIHANAFVRGGFAVLLYDKRGSGKSTGDLDTSDYDDLAADLAAGVRYLRERRDIVADQVGVLGRSEGAWIGTLAASRDPRIAFVVLSSGSGVRPYEQTLFSTARAIRATGATDEDVDAATEAKAALWAFYGQIAKLDAPGSPSAAMQERRDALEKRLQSFARFAPQIPQRVRNPRSNPAAFYRAFTQKINYDPTPAFREARAPLLLVIGANDEVVDPPSTVAVFDALRQSGRDVTVRTLPDVGHSLVVMTKDGPRYPADYPEVAVRWARAVIDRARKQ